LSVLYSHELGSTRAKYTVQLGQSNNFLYTVSYQQIKTWSLLSEGNQSKSWEKVWANWNCLSLVTSHVVGTSRAQHTTSYMSYKQMKTLSLFTTRQPIQILKKSVTSVILSLITSHAVSTSRAEQTTFYRGRATTSFISYHQLKTLSLLSKVLKKSVTSVFFVIDHFSRH
jgi:hypothetical protein